jgi:hypothetical protein
MQRLRENFSRQALDFAVEFPRCAASLFEHRGIQKQRDAPYKWRIFLSHFRGLARLRQIRRPRRKFRI